MKLRSFYKNRLCLCGSGKKLKDCCEKETKIYVTSLIDKQLIDFQQEILQYGLKKYKVEILHDFQTRINHNYVKDNEDYEMFHYIHAVWFVVTIPVKMGKTILQLYIERFGNSSKYVKINRWLNNWNQVRPVAGRVISSSLNELIVNDLFSKENILIRLMEPLNYKKNDFLYSFLLPLGNEFMFFIEPIHFYSLQNIERFLLNVFEKSIQTNYFHFLQKDFFTIVNELLLIKLTKNPKDFPWKKKEQESVSLIFKKMLKKESASEWMIRSAYYLWFKYCIKKPKLIKKLETYAAAIHYLALTTNPLTSLTKKEIAIKYNIAQSTLSVAISDLQYALSEEIKDLRKIHYVQIEKALTNSDDQIISWIN